MQPNRTKTVVSGQTSMPDLSGGVVWLSEDLSKFRVAVPRLVLL